LIKYIGAGAGVGDGVGVGVGVGVGGLGVVTNASDGAGVLCLRQTLNVCTNSETLKMKKAHSRCCRYMHGK